MRSIRKNHERRCRNYRGANVNERPRLENRRRVLAMWASGILFARNRLGNELALESGGQDESSSAGGDSLGIDEGNVYASMFADPTIYAPSPAVAEVPVPAPVLLTDTEAPLPFTGPITVVHPQDRDLRRPLVQTARRLPPGRKLQHGLVGRRGTPALRDGAKPTASSAAAAHAPRGLTDSQRRKRRKKAMRAAILAKRPRH